MKRLVYSPSINVWIKTDTGVFDLSPYITEFQIDRRINQVSSAKLTFRNPKIVSKESKLPRHMFTEHTAQDGTIRPMFHPMDPIIITLTRLKGRPVQVFTGYCDTTPYVQLYPGTASLDASCTLKRLLYTYWDPALPFVRDFMNQNGWGVSNTGASYNPTAEGKHTPYLNDSSIGGLLYRVLTDIGGWDDKNIYIQELPGKNIGQLVANLYKEIEKEEASSIKEFHDFLKDIIGKSAYGSAGGASTDTTGGATAPATENVVTNNMSETALPWSSTGKGSQYGSSHKYNYTDPGDDSYGSQPPASGLDPDVPGIAVRRDIGTGSNLNWYVVRSPNGRAAALPQSDWGPNDSTGRVIDVNTPAAVGVFGYSQAADHSVNFPTDQGVWRLYYCGQGSKGKTKAETIVRNGKL